MFFVKRSLNKLSRTDEILFKGTCLRFLASKHAKEIAGDEESAFLRTCNVLRLG